MMPATNLSTPRPFAPRSLRRTLRAGWWLLLATTAFAQVTVSQMEVGNVSTTRFDAIWQVSDPSATPSLAIYRDAAGTDPVHGDLEVEFFPVRVGDPTVPGSGSAADRVAGQNAIAAQGLVWVRIGNATPGTRYYLTPGSSDGTGASNLDLGPSLVPVTTASTVGFVSELRQVLVEFPDLAPGAVEGTLVRLAAEGSAWPLFAAVGDGAPADAAYFNLAHLLNAAGETNRSLDAALPLTLGLRGDGAPGGTEELSLAFDGSFAVAAVETVAFGLEVSAVAALAFDPIGSRREHVPFTVAIRALDEDGAIVTDFDGTVLIGGSTSFAQGEGETSAFTAGELPAHALTLTGAGMHTLTATLPDGSLSAVGGPFELLPGETYDTWREATFGNAASDPDVSDPLRDPDQDGRSNLLEFALGLDPMVSDIVERRTLVYAHEAGGAVSAEFSYYRLKDRVGILYTVESANRPEGPWSAVAPAPGAETVEVIDSNTERVSMELDVPGDGTPLFIRLKVSTD